MKLISEMNIEERQEIFTTWLDGVDLYYEYSDDVSVFRAGEAKMEELYLRARNELDLGPRYCNQVVRKIRKQQEA